MSNFDRKNSNNHSDTFRFENIDLRELKIDRECSTISSESINFEDVRAQLAQNAEAICREYLSNGRCLEGKWSVGDIDNTPSKKKEGSFTVTLSGPFAGKWTEFNGGDHGDLLDVICYHEKVDVLEAARIADNKGFCSSLSQSFSSPNAVKEKAEMDEKKARRRAQAETLWNEAKPVWGTLAETYLRSRGIQGVLPDTLRFHPSLYMEGEYYPALISAVISPEGDLLAIHRTFLKDDGSGKADLQGNKRLLGSPDGHGVWLGRHDKDSFAICEGIETGLSLREAQPEMPVLCVGSKSNFGNLILSETTKEPLLCVDVGAEAEAVELAKKLAAKGMDARIASPGEGKPEGYDFNDLLNEEGCHAVQDALDCSFPVNCLRSAERKSGDTKLQSTGPISARDLVNAKFPEVRYIVDRVLPEGFTLMCGAPKLGKSWLSLGLGIAVAEGSNALGNLQCSGGDVLYLALEDNPRRLQTRLKQILQGRDAPSNLTICTTWPRLGDQGGEQKIEEWLADHPEASLVIVDTFAVVRPEEGKKSNSYQEDYSAMRPLHQLASKYQVSIIAVHHLRKMPSEDPLEMVSGTTGLSGAADAIWILTRDRGATRGNLFVTGRDIEDEATIALEFNKATGAWGLREDGIEEQKTPEQQAAFDTIKELSSDGSFVRPQAVADALRLDGDSSSLRHVLSKLRSSPCIEYKAYTGYRYIDDADQHSGPQKVTSDPIHTTHTDHNAESPPSSEDQK